MGVDEVLTCAGAAYGGDAAAVLACAQVEFDDPVVQDDALGDRIGLGSGQRRQEAKAEHEERRAILFVHGRSFEEFCAYPG